MRSESKEKPRKILCAVLGRPGAAGLVSIYFPLIPTGDWQQRAAELKINCTDSSPRLVGRRLG